MKTRQQVLDLYEQGDCPPECDGRTYDRLVRFYPEPVWAEFNRVQKEPNYQPIAWTKENILKELKRDVAFGFEKALARRALTAEMMFEVVKMWMWVLDDSLQHWPDDQYLSNGLPYFKAVALKYGLDNPIGDDKGSEVKYYYTQGLE